MRIDKLVQANSDYQKAILVFGGFAFLPEAYCLKSEANVYLISDYVNLNLDFSELLKYEQISLIAYSMGVMMATKINLSALNITKALAVCGSPLGIDDLKGIPLRSFKLSARAFDARAFLSNCALEESAKSLLNSHPKSELLALLDYAKLPSNNLCFDKAYIASEDKIFAPEALKLAFKDTLQVHIKAPHFCFNHFASWQDFE